MSLPTPLSQAVPAPPAQGAGPPAPEAWLDVGDLLSRSQPRTAGRGYLLLLPPVGMLAMFAAIVLMIAAPGRSLWVPVIALGSLLFSAGAMFLLARLSALARAERRAVTEVEELITLRHFVPAAIKLRMLLSRPMRLPQHRVLALIQLVRVLSRYERFDDAVEVADVVLEHPMTDPATRFAVGCGRAMALLRAGRLFDAGQAITTLRREVGRIDDALRRADGQRPEADDPASRETVEEGEEAAALDSVLASEGTSAEEMPRPPFDSAALTMVEMYRDIQTRHSDEALAMLEEKRPALREALGVRLGDALGLAALASHRQPDVDRARRYWSEATCLTPEVELLRRYPELAEVAGAYPATALPVDGTGGAA